MTRWWLGLGVLGVAMAAGAAVGPEAEVAQVRSVPAVRTAEARPAPERREVLLHGVTRAVDRADVAFTVGGRLGERRVRLGDRVRAGDVLAVLDVGAFEHARQGAEASVADLQARLEQLERDRARLESLGATSVSAAELERVRTEAASVSAALDGARARLAEAGRQRREAVLRAPFDGVVAAVLREAGESVAPGVPVFRLAGEGGLEVEVQVPERVWSGLQAGDEAIVDLPGLGRQVPGSLRSVGGAAGLSGLLPVVVSLQEASGLVAGLTAQVALRVPVEPGVAVPVGAVVDPVGGAPSVFVVREGTASRVAVAPGVLLGDDVVVRGALAPGDAVVVAGQARLLDGDGVETVQ